jgi:hypothetical protein
VYVGRAAGGMKASPYANPFGLRRRLGRYHRLRRYVEAALEEVAGESAPDLSQARYAVITAGSPAVAVTAYRLWLAAQPELIARARRDLCGRDLADWCPLPAAGQPDLCHAAVLLRLAAPPCSARNIPGLPLSPACRDGLYSACTGFSGGHDTYHCGHRYHWCPSGEHPRELCPGGCAS